MYKNGFKIDSFDDFNKSCKEVIKYLGSLNEV